MYVGLFQTLVGETTPPRGTAIHCDSFQGIARIRPDLQGAVVAQGVSVIKAFSGMRGIQLADVAAGTARRFLNQQNVERFLQLQPLVATTKEFFAAR